MLPCRTIVSVTEKVMLGLNVCTSASFQTVSSDSNISQIAVHRMIQLATHTLFGKSQHFKLQLKCPMAPIQNVLTELNKLR